jgi:site-specific DNA recombinase
MPTQTPDILTRSPMEILAELTAVIYLRVSSTGQLTGYSPEGYSIDGQRQACERHAERLGARIIATYVEPGASATSTQRPALQRMLAELPKLRPNFVIFYDLSRVAREEADAFWLLGEIKRCGATLESTLERVDDSPQGLLLFAIMAGVNAFRSRGDGEKVRMGLERKFADGGTIGPTRTGYLNVRGTADDGREVRSIALDEDRYRLIQIAFDAFATGDHSITTLRDLMEELGLRTRPTAKRPAKPLSRNGIYRILRDDYYIGVVTHKGVKGEGRHEAIIDRETFEKVQQILEAHRLSGDRTKKHFHYLKGSIFCDHCGRRLVYGRHRGKGGVYEYFSCLSHQARRPSCGARHLPVDAVEQAIEEFYRSIQLTPEQIEKVRRDVREQVDERLAVARKQSEHHSRKLRTLQDEQQKLVQLYYKGGVSEEVLQAEQTRIESERTQAHHWVQAATHEASDIMDALDDALSIAGRCHETYIAGSPMLRRLMNQTMFERLLIRSDLIQCDQQPVFGHISRLGRGCQPPAKPRRPRNAQNPRFSWGLGSNVDQMVRMRGLEPPPGCPDTDLNRARLPIPPHPLAKAKISQRRCPGATPGPDPVPAPRMERMVGPRRADRNRTLAQALLASERACSRRYRPGD